MTTSHDTATGPDIDTAATGNPGDDSVALPAGLDVHLERLRGVVDSGATDVPWRLAALRRLRRMLVDAGDELADALAADLGKPRRESAISEIGVVIGDLDDVLRRVRRSARPRPVSVPLVLAPATAWVRRQPYGLALVIAPWNYPLNLALAPIVGALGAGNTVVLKPSELAPATSATLARLLRRYVGDDAVVVVEGGAAETTALLQRRFDLVVYTGGARVGRIVAEAAARHLTPTVLELGGKSPVWVDETADLDVAADRIVWGKLMNVGQTCVAPDHVLCTPAVAERLVPRLEAAITRMYGADPRRSPDYGRAVTVDAARRLRAMAGLGPAPDADPRYVPPVVLTGAAATPAMTEEIFGPLLPVVTVDPADPVTDAIARIRAGEKPLALYLFTRSADVRRRFTRETSSGALGINVTVVHQTVPGLPFGGVGGSGYGNYHGRWSLATFSHDRAILAKPTRPDTLKVAYPPYRRLTDVVYGLQARRPRDWGRRRPPRA
ncbi:aldehyde dehydrogenase family protein [Tersicoccus sp. MR15.9]|uniref:aldehyde dehydrogenase family protein n=1 Tax=Tersicoccus mangrovi TaxID=3121635 RepID=UPI002FE66064